jgi:hypothetical protein
MAELRAAWGGRCVICGSAEQLDFAHIKETNFFGGGRGQSRRYHDVKQHPECYVLACRDCHTEHLCHLEGKWGMHR